MQDLQAIAQHFETVTDALGKRIDPEIMQTVVALNALDVPTVMSCGGHLDHRGLLLPYVDIEPSEPSYRALVKQEQALVMVVKETRKKDDIDAMHEVQDQIRLLQSVVRDRIVGYLTQFYADRHTAFDARLILSKVGNCRLRLQNQGALDFWINATEKVQQQKLQEYREEMADFTAFLMR
jgi:hypothetical protein